MPEATERVRLTRHGGILVAEIVHPPGNCLDEETFRALAACHAAFASPDTDAVVLTGAGRVFCKGMDVDEMRRRRQALTPEAVRYGNEVFSAIADLRKPVIASINGACMGAGLELALACHLRVCSDKARLGLPELTIGLIPGLGGLPRLCRVVGEARALEMIMLGDLVSAPDALAMRLVSRVYPRDELMPRTLGLVRTILSTDHDSLRVLLDIVAETRGRPEAEAIRRSADAFGPIAGRVLDKLGG